MKRPIDCLGLLVALCVGVFAMPVWAEEESSEGSKPTIATQEATQTSEGAPAEGVEAVTDEPAPEIASSVAAATPAPSGDGLISVDFKDADIRQVLRIISLKSGVDIVAGSDVEGLVTIKLTNVPWEEALDIILRTYGFTYERKERIVRVMTIAALEQEALSTEVFPLNYSNAKDVPDIINEMLSERGRVKFDERTNTVIVTDIPSSLFQIKKVIERIDQRTPQVLIESRIVETKLEKDENLGIRWSDSFAFNQAANEYPSTFPFKSLASFGSLHDFISTPTSRVAGPSATQTATTAGAIGIGTLSTPALAMTLNVLRTRTNTKIVSNPSLAVLNNQEAKIHIGEEFPVPTFSIDPQTGNTTVSGFEKKTIGTVLAVTPHVNPSQEIVVDLKPEVISVGGNATFVVGSSGQTVELPRFNTQTVKTQVRVENGETVAIGGLVKTLEVSQTNKVPILGDIPIIGLLFTNRQKFGGGQNPALQQDLLIFLTVKLMEPPPTQRAVVSNITN